MKRHPFLFFYGAIALSIVIIWIIEYLIGSDYLWNNPIVWTFVVGNAIVATLAWKDRY